MAADETGIVRVADYRLYGLDGVKKVASGEWFEADDDETAIRIAKKMMNGHECELWTASGSSPGFRAAPTSVPRG